MPLNSFGYSPVITNPNKPRAVVDYMKWMDTTQIKNELEKTKKNFGVLMVNIDYDNNSGNIVRTANAFGAIEVILYGRRKFDRRSSMGTEFYMNFQQIRYVEEIDEALKGYELIIGLDNIEGSINVFDYSWNISNPKNEQSKKPKTLICLGQESTGLPDEIIKRCHKLVHIPQYGSVRSLNVGTAAGIAMYDFVMKSQR